MLGAPPSDPILHQAAQESRKRGAHIVVTYAADERTRFDTIADSERGAEYAGARRIDESVKGVTWVVAVFAGVTMVSNIPFWSFKEVHWKKRVPLWVILACVVAISIVASRPSLILFALFMAYGLSGYVMWAIGHRARPVLPEE